MPKTNRLSVYLYEKLSNYERDRFAVKNIYGS